MNPHSSFKGFFNFNRSMLTLRQTYILVRIMPQLVKLTITLMLLSNTTLAQQYEASRNHRQAQVLKPIIEPLTENKKRRQGFDHTRHAIPHPVDPKNVALFESSDEEVYDTGISSETAEKIRELSSACKELQLKVSNYFEE
jgi:DNA-binding LytR/AlgR family response regulator